MTQEQKDLLFKDLCGRLPYGVKLHFSYVTTSPAILKGIDKDFIECDIAVCELEDIKPCLFPMSSMTEEQEYQYREVIASSLNHYEVYDWLNAHHFDYRGLIDKGLAIDATSKNIY